ncbi:MAG: hypothetical protein GY870_16135 [archaeon]|nr:hypothetical protein [archaeon]
MVYQVFGKAICDFNTAYGILEKYGNVIIKQNFNPQSKSSSANFVGEKFYMRNGNRTAIIIFLEGKRETRDMSFEIVAFAGGQGLLGKNKGSHRSFVQNVLDDLTKNNISYEFHVNKR